MYEQAGSSVSGDREKIQYGTYEGNEDGVLTVYEYGNAESANVLIQPVEDHDLDVIENEVRKIRELTENNFRLLAVKVERWNDDLSPWQASPVFGDEGFGGNAADTLTEILNLTYDKNREYYIGGYSLAGLFAIWAAFQADAFSGAAAASPSVWFPGFLDYMKSNEILTREVYLSLGDREAKTRNPLMATVGDRIREAYEHLSGKGVSCILEWNPGNHFKNPDLRTARAFSWLLTHR